MEFYGSEEEDLSGFDITQHFVVDTLSTGLGVYVGFVVKKKTENIWSAHYIICTVSNKSLKFHRNTYKIQNITRLLL